MPVIDWIFRNIVDDDGFAALPDLVAAGLT
jgi:hypothetical protein